MRIGGILWMLQESTEDRGFRLEVKERKVSSSDLVKVPIGSLTCNQTECVHAFCTKHSRACCKIRKEKNWRSKSMHLIW